MTISEEIKQARSHLQVTQAGMAHLLGVSRVSVAQWETGKSSPSRKHRELLNRVMREHYVSVGMSLRKSQRIGSLSEHLWKALECLTDEFNAGRAGPSGLRAQAIAHVRYALLLITGERRD